jgi:hypothetical protein
MLGKNKRAGQAATELAVFGAILIFLLGTIVRNAVSNSYEQNQNFKAMRMAMLASWNDSKANPGHSSQITAHNSAQILFIEDRQAPDFGKYELMDRTPFIASGSGTFTYNLMYPLSNAADYTSSLPVLDMYINGQHFPFAMASYVPDWAITPDALQKEGFPSCPASGGEPSTTEPSNQQQCMQDQSCRFQREWAGGTVRETQFLGIVPVSNSTITSGTCQALSQGEAQRECQDQANACTIFVGELATTGVISVQNGSNCTSNIPPLGIINSSLSASSLASSSQWNAFQTAFEKDFPSYTTSEITSILNMIKGDAGRYKLFYTLVPNPGQTSSDGAVSGGSTPAASFSTRAPVCSSHPCANQELSTDVPLLDYNGNATSDGKSSTNLNGVMQFDLLRDANYPQVLSAFPPDKGIPNMRDYIAWQWAATAGTTAAMIGLDAANNQYPTYDIDGRLKEVTIFNIWQDSGGTTHVTYEDSEGGDIDGTWDTNSCGAKPGLQKESQIFTFTKNGTNATNHDGGTYLMLKEGKWINTENGFVVRSANKKDTIDLIQRTIQLSNNTHRFCDINNQRLPYVGMVCTNWKCSDGTVCAAGSTCSDGTACQNGTSNCALAQMSNPPNLIVNPVEACTGESSQTDNCFQENTVKETCYDTNPAVNRIFVRSRLEDRRGTFWATDTTGQLRVGK